MSGKLIILAAPSGSGKTTMARYLLEQYNNLSFSVSATTRLPRTNERHGENYYFLSVKSFKEKIERGDFVEHEEVYPDMFYGTLKSEVDRIWKLGKSIVFDVDVKGGVSLKNYYNEKALSVFVKCPSFEILSERLITRSTETEVSLKMRLAKARAEMEYEPKFDISLLNDDMSVALSSLDLLVRNFLK